MAGVVTVQPHQKAGSGSDRAFGVVFAIALLAIGGYALAMGRTSGWIAIAAAVALAIVASVAPRALGGANRAWHTFGLLLGRIVNPIVLGVLFFVVVTPIGLLMRLFGKRPLSLEYEPDAETYWVERTPRGPAPDSMRDQF